MELILGQTANHGSRHEVVTLGVIEDSQLARFMVGSFAVTRGKLGQRLVDAFWFPKWSVKSGDKVFVHTGKGQNHRKRSEDGTGWEHHFYMRRSAPLWMSKRRRAVLIEIEGASFMDPHNEDKGVQPVWGILR